MRQIGAHLVYLGDEMKRTAHKRGTDAEDRIAEAIASFAATLWVVSLVRFLPAPLFSPSQAARRGRPQTHRHDLAADDG
jgi:hypothetical protein